MLDFKLFNGGCKQTLRKNKIAVTTCFNCEGSQINNFFITFLLLNREIIFYFWIEVFFLRLVNKLLLLLYP